MERHFKYNEDELDVLSEIRLEALSTDPVYKRCKVVTFSSQSAGVGRKRKPREVQLLVVDNKCAYQVKDGEVKGRQSGVAIDVLAMEILTDLPDEQRTAQMLLDRATRISSEK